MGKTLKFKLKNPFSWSLTLALLCGLIGFLEGALKGAASSAAYAIINSFLTLLGLVPFFGVPLYLYFSGLIAHLLSSLSSTSTPLGFAISFILYLILTIFINVLASIIAIALMLLGLKEVLSWGRG